MSNYDAIGALEDGLIKAMQDAGYTGFSTLGKGLKVVSDFVDQVAADYKAGYMAAEYGRYGISVNALLPHNFPGIAARKLWLGTR